MNVKQLVKKLEKSDDLMEVFVLIKGDSAEYEISDVEEGELEDNNSMEDVVFILA
jgi:hypothetical protein